MVKINETIAKKIMLFAALFNWCVAGSFIFYEFTFSLLGVGLIPEHPLWLYLFTGVVAVFGYGYYLASRDFNANRNMVHLGILGKLWVYLLASYYFIIGDAAWQLYAVASCDGIFTIVFIVLLIKTPRSTTASNQPRK